MHTITASTLPLQGGIPPWLWRVKDLAESGHPLRHPFPEHFHETVVKPLMDKHKVGRPDMITFNSDGSYLIQGESPEAFDQVNKLYEGPDHPYA